MATFQNTQLRQILQKSKKPPSNLSFLPQRNPDKIKSLHIIRENQWDKRFIYNKIPEYDSYKDKNVKIHLSIKNYSYRKDTNNNSKENIINEEGNELNNLMPLTKNINYRNGTNLIRTSSAKMKDISFNNNLKFINMINLNNINKLWDELCISKAYRQLFSHIYNVLNDEDKQKIYQKEINELISIKNDISILKTNIEKRLNVIKDITQLNNNLNIEVVNKDNNKKDITIKELSNNIEKLREQTINVCFSMKKLKSELNSIKNLDKYDIELISEKFNFDKNYIIKMKSEIFFLKQGFFKYYFNIENEQTPFLLNASKKNDNPNMHTIPLKKEIENDIIECIFYIYQELIAYQNEKVNKNILKRISPLRAINRIQEENLSVKLTNGKDEKNNNDNNNNILKKSFSASNIKLNRKNFIYSKKKFLKIDKNGNNLLLNQYTSYRNNKIDKNKNMSMKGIKYNNPLSAKNKFIIDGKNKKEKCKDEIKNNKEENKKIVFTGLNEKNNNKKINENENNNKVNE